MPVRVSSLVVMAFAVGCVSSDFEPGASEVEQQFGGGCDITMCGSNSPQIAEFGFWDLNMPPAISTPGQPNNVGLQVLRFTQGSQSYLPRVIGGRLYAIGPSTTLFGSGLVNGYFLLRNGSRFFKLRITEVTPVESWAVPASGSTVVLEAYKLDWAEFTNGWGRFANMCNNPPERESPDLLTMTGQNVYRTLLFEGDRIDAAGKHVTGIDTTWFNLGCAGSALAKMALTGHTEAAHVTGTFDTTLAERQTMLKMLSGDYCDKGKPFTVAGQPLNWRDDHGTMQLTALTASPPQPLVLEGRWNASGAVCLDKPRVDVHWTQLGETTFGSVVSVYDQLQAWCGSRMPPQCADGSFNTDGYHLLTATVPYHP